MVPDTAIRVFAAAAVCCSNSLTVVYTTFISSSKSFEDDMIRLI